MLMRWLISIERVLSASWASVSCSCMCSFRVLPRAARSPAPLPAMLSVCARLLNDD